MIAKGRGTRAGGAERIRWSGGQVVSESGGQAGAEGGEMKSENRKY